VGGSFFSAPNTERCDQAIETIGALFMIERAVAKLRGRNENGLAQALDIRRSDRPAKSAPIVERLRTRAGDGEDIPKTYAGALKLWGLETRLSARASLKPINVGCSFTR